MKIHKIKYYILYNYKSVLEAIVFKLYHIYFYIHKENLKNHQGFQD